MLVKGKALVVTGAGSGIGRAVALELLARGSKVAGVDISQGGLDETTELASAGDRFASFTCDVTDREAVEALPGLAQEALGSIDGYVHCAGIIQPFVKIVDLDYDAIARVIDINLYGTIHMVKAFVPALLDRPEAHVANVSSMGGFAPVPGQAIYGASKAAVKLMSEALYAETIGTGLGVSVIMPGAVATNITDNSGVDVSGMAQEDGPEPKTTSAEDAATTIVDGVEKNKLHILVGRDAQAMYAMNRAAPKRSIHMIQSRMKDLLD